MAIEAQTTGANGHGAGILGEMGIEDAQQIMDQTRQAMDHAVDTAATFIRERPIICLAGAVAIGYVIGKIVSR